MLVALTRRPAGVFAGLTLARRPIRFFARLVLTRGLARLFAWLALTRRAARLFGRFALGPTATGRCFLLVVRGTLGPGSGRGIAGHRDFGDVLVDQLGDRIDILAVRRGGEGDGDTGAPGATGAADAVDIVLGVRG